jgi:hypothetical protein
VEVGVSQSRLSKPVYIWRRDLRAVATKIGKADIIKHDEEKIWGSLWCALWRRPPRLGVSESSTYNALEIFLDGFHLPLAISSINFQRIQSTSRGSQVKHRSAY